MRQLPELEGVSHSYHRVRGFRMHVAEAGEGEPLVMLHGWPQHWWCWHKLIPSLAERYRVICPDLRGYGWSDAPSWGYEKESFASDVAALLDRLELSNVRLVGHDWGGMAGFLLCIKRPDLVRQYLALNTPHPWGRPDPRNLRHIWRFWYGTLMAMPVIGSRFARALPALQRRLGRTPPGWSDENAQRYLSQFEEPARAHASTLTYRTFLTRELPENARGRWNGEHVHAPTLFLYGTADPVIRPSLLRGFDEHTDDGRLESIERVGHFIAEERPDIVLDRALPFFANELKLG